MPREVTIQQFLRYANDLYDNTSPGSQRRDRDNQATWDFVDYMLGGIDSSTNPAPVALGYQELALQDEDYEMYRDLDSAIVMSKDFPWVGDFDIFSVPGNVAPIGSLHFTTEFETDEGDRTPADPGHHPALRWACCGDGGRHTLYLVLPHYDEGNIREQEFREIVYDASYRTVEELNDDLLPTWAPTYQAEKDRTRGFQGSHSTQSRKKIDRDRGYDFANSVIEYIRQNDFGRHAYWLLQIRNEKDGTRCSLDLDSHQLMMDRLLEDVFRADAVIYVDVACEIHAFKQTHRMSVFAKRDALQELTCLLLDIDEADFLSGKQTTDMWAGLVHFAGTRILFDPPVGQFQAAYFQLYTTDKVALYNATKGNPMLAGVTLLKMQNGDDTPVRVSSITQTLAEFQRKPVPIVLRAEARVPLQRSHLVFRQESMSIANIEPHVAVLHPSIAWGWRVMRCRAVKLLMQEAAAAPRDARSQRDALVLVAAAVYLWNATHQTPPDKNWDRTLCRGVWRTTTQREDVQYGRQDVELFGFYTPTWRTSEIPIADRGAIWLPRIRKPGPEGNVIRFENMACDFDEAQVAAFFNLTWRDLAAIFQPKNTAVAGGYKRNTKPSKPIAPRPMDLDEGFDPLPADSQAFDLGADLHPAAHFGEPARLDQGPAELLLSMCSEVMQRIGSSSNGTVRYCTLNQAQRLCVGFNTFEDPEMGKYFDGRFYYARSATEWNKTRGLLLPGQATTVNHLGKQGWTIKAMPSWHKFIRLRDSEEFTVIHKRLIELFNGLLWFPVLRADKLFRTKAPQLKKFPARDDYRAVGVQPGSKAIVLVMNPAMLPGAPRPYLARGVPALDAWAVENQDMQNADMDIEEDEDEAGRQNPSLLVFAKPVRLDPQDRRATANFGSIRHGRHVVLPENIARAIRERQEEEESSGEE
ncbi:hypothetical protein C8F01DRAFT_1092988 [Mycena amicta]|nr:hypothetical protein C8F01DRAFT_1092988 [Mycena amicta]